MLEDMDSEGSIYPVALSCKNYYYEDSPNITEDMVVE